MSASLSSSVPYAHCHVLSAETPPKAAALAFVFGTLQVVLKGRDRRAIPCTPFTHRCIVGGREKICGRGGGGIGAPFPVPPPPLFRAQNVWQPETVWEGLAPGVRGYAPTHITSKRSPRRANRCEVCIAGKSVLRKFAARAALWPNVRAIFTSTDWLYIKALKFERLSPFPEPPPPVWHSVGLRFLYGALDSPPFFPPHVASGRCFLPAAAPPSR